MNTNRFQSWRDADASHDAHDDRDTPENPLGPMELSNDELQEVSGGAAIRRSKGILSIGRFCTSLHCCCAFPDIKLDLNRDAEGGGFSGPSGDPVGTGGVGL